MSTIRDVRFIPLQYAVPGRPYGMARGLTGFRQCGLVEVETADGVVGIGEAWGPPKVTAAYLELIKGYYLGRELYDRELIWHRILGKHYHFGVQNQMVACVSGLNIAIHDAIGKTLGLPLYKLLGGKGRDRVPVYASGGYITDDPRRDLEAQLEPLRRGKHIGFKLKIGLGPASDAERVKLAREALGGDVLLMVDANGNYTVDEALASMDRIAPYGVHWYEEPLPPQDFDGLSVLSAKGRVPIATGEALYTAFEFKRLIETRAVDVVQPDISLCGGLDQARAVWLLCALHNVRLSPHVWGGAVGLAAAVHFVAALPDYPHTDNVPFPVLVEYDVGTNALRDELLATPLAATDGYIQVPDGPGLGIELDPAAIERYRMA